MAENTRRVRHDQNLTQEDLAEKAGLTARYIGAIERAKVSASIAVLGKIAKALEIEPADLLRPLPRSEKETGGL